MTNIENPIRLKLDMQEAALVLQSMRHPILSQTVLQAINLLEAHERHIGNPFEGSMGEPPRSLRTVPVTNYPDWNGTAYRDGYRLIDGDVVHDVNYRLKP